MSYGYDESRRSGMQSGGGARDAGLSGVPGKRTLTEALPAMNASTVEDPSVHTEQQAAIDYPHAARIEGATGIRIPGHAVVDPDACETRGVLAFTNGTITYFASSTPDLHVAAHEAVHVMQHAGVTGDAGLGVEEHAHQVANAITEGDAPDSLLGHGAPVASAVRHYTYISVADQESTGHWAIGKNARVGDQGRTVTPVAQTHEAYADPALIVESNRILKAKKSGVELEPGSPGPSGPAPDGSGTKSTVQVKYKIAGDPEGNAQYPDDCGAAARETMGEAGKGSLPRAVYRDAAGYRQQTAGSYDPADYRDEIYLRTGLGTTVAEARAAYDAMSPAARDAYDRRHGINRYAAPGVGQAYTRRTADHLVTDPEEAGYNFHWGGVVLVAGPDRVTFENYVDDDPATRKNDAWFFATYGPPSKAGQTWHERWANGVGNGVDMGTTMVAETSPDPSPFTRAAAAMPTTELVRRMSAVTDPAERSALVAEVHSRWLEVIVHVAQAQERRSDNVYVKARAGKTFQTAELKMRRGQTHTFVLPLAALLPITDGISVEVREADLGPDDTISKVHFKAPFTPTVDNRPWDGATYHTTVRFDR